MLADSGADIICLQEVNQTFLNLLHSPSGCYKRLGEYYMAKTKMHWYDTVILTRYPCRFYKKKFETSMMGRCVLAAVFEFGKGERKVTVGVNCVHLESLENAE
jgi:endonuclease/exonuclease/phosphatase family metal-dependent hydrolase